MSFINKFYRDPYCSSKVLSFLLAYESFPPFGEIVFTHFWKDQILIIANLVKFCPLKSVRFYSSICFIRFSMNISVFEKVGVPLVGLDGLEPSTSRLSGARSNHLSYRPLFSGDHRFFVIFAAFAAGGDDGVRTHDPLLAGQVLSQLSYTPD